MKKSLLPIILCIALLSVPFVFANEEFTVGTSGGEENLCPTNTASISIPIENTGDEMGSYSISLSGSAQKWAVAAPTGFSLNPGASKTVYVWVTPSTKTLPGEYDLTVSIDGGSAGTEELEYIINVESCHEVNIEAEESSKNSCPGKLTTYAFVVENTGEYTEDYQLSLNGAAKEWATLSKQTLKLASGESEEILAYIKSPLKEIGTYDLSLTTQSKYSDAVDTEDVEIILESCYEYSITSAKDVYSFCDHTQAKIPLVIKNEGIETNTISLNAEGVDWANLENNKVTLEAGEATEVNLIISPDYYTTGEFSVKISAFGEVGELSKEHEISLNIRPCFVTNLEISLDEDSICEQGTKTYEVSITNAGEYKEPYSLSVEGPSWATLDKSFVELEAGESETASLSIEAPQETGQYNIKIIAMSQEPSKTSDEDTLSLEVISKEICFSLGVSAELNEVDVARGEGALIPINIENNGKEEATYSLEVSGAGASFAQLTPATVIISPGNSETAHLYVAIPEEAEKEEYILSVFARIADGTVSASDTVKINVVKAGEGVVNVDHVEPVIDNGDTEETTGNETSGVLSGITGALGGIGSSITGAVTSVTSGTSSIADNWKYIIGAVIILLIIVLLWLGLKSEDDYEETVEIIKKKKDEETSEKPKEEQEDTKKDEEKSSEESETKDDNEETSEEKKEESNKKSITEEDNKETETKEDTEKTEEPKEDEEKSSEETDTQEDTEETSEKPKSKKKSALINRIKELLEEED